MDWKQLLVYITGTVDQELLLRNEYGVCQAWKPTLRVYDRMMRLPNTASDRPSSFIRMV